MSTKKQSTAKPQSQTKPTPKATFKDFVAATGAELKAAGKPVCHGTLMEAMSLAMNSRSWNHFCAELGLPAPVTTTATTEPAAALTIERTDVFMPTEPQIFAARVLHTLAAQNRMSFSPVPKTFPRTEKGVDDVLHFLQSAPENGVPLNFTSTVPDGDDFMAYWCPVTDALTGSVVTGTYLVTSSAFETLSLLVTVSDPSQTERLDWNDSTRLREALDPLLAPELQAFGASRTFGPVISAYLNSDDGHAKAVFDARPYLEGATDEQLLKVWDEGLSGGYATDDIAETVNSLVPNGGIQEVYDYIAAVNRFTDVGSTCGVEAYDFVQWLRKERLHLYAALLCEQEAIVVTHDEETGYAFSDSTLVHKGLVPKHGFDTKDNALLAAAKRLMELGEELEYLHLC